MGPISELDANEHAGKQAAAFRERVDPTGGPRRRLGLLALTAWVGGTAAVALVGFVGTPPSQDRGPSLAIASIATSSAPAAAAARSIFVDHPVEAGDVVTSRDLVIRGRIAPEVSTVRIVLESRNGKPLAAQSIDAGSPLRGGLVPFEGRFRLSLARPFGRVVALVIAVDADGVPIDAVRRRFELGDLLEDGRGAGY